MFTVSFPYDLRNDDIATLVQEMKADLNLSAKNIKRAERKLNKAIQLHMALHKYSAPRLTIEALGQMEETKRSPDVQSLI
jgi:hypothetical protein